MSLRLMFSRVSGKYDLVNRVMTLGLDNVWREKCAKECAKGNVIVDLCCGTGKLIQSVSQQNPNANQMVGVDFNREMLKVAITKNKTKSRQTQITGQKQIILNLSFVNADAANLPFKEGAVDTIGIAFGFRNLIYENPKATNNLKETVRILKKKGNFICVETSQPPNKLNAILLHLYFLHVVPLVGWLITKRKDIYAYLGGSAANFADAEKVKHDLKIADFQKADFELLTFGAVALFIATK